MIKSKQLLQQLSNRLRSKSALTQSATKKQASTSANQHNLDRPEDKTKSSDPLASPNKIAQMFGNGLVAEKQSQPSKGKLAKQLTQQFCHHCQLTPSEAVDLLPLNVDQTQSLQVWMVVSGQVEINAHVTMEAESRQYVRKHYLNKLSPGELFFSFSAIEDGIKLVATPSKNTKMVQCDLSQLLNATKQDETFLEAAAQLLDAWLSTINSWLEIAASVNEALAISADKPKTLRPDQQLVAEQGTLWCPVTTDACYLANQILVSANDTALSHLPISPSLAISYKNTVDITAIPTTTWLAHIATMSDPKQDLLQLHQLLIARLMQQYIASHTKAQEMVGQRDLAQQTEYARSFEDLAGVLEKQRVIPDLVTDQPLIGAFQLVLHNLNMHKESKVLTKISNKNITVESLAKQAGMFYRKISLSKDNWQRDHGPLLAFYGDSELPCALIPAKQGGYLLHDPSQGAPIQVTADIARQLKTTAWMLYQPMAQRKLRIRDMFQFAKAGIHRDFSHFLMAAVLASLLSLSTPILIGWIFDPVIQNALTNQLFAIVVAMGLIGIGIGVFSIVQAMIILRVEGRMDWVAQAGLWDRLLKLPVSFFRRFHVGDLVYRMQGIEQMRGILSSAVTQGVVSGLTVFFTFILMLYYEWHLAVVALGLVSVFVLLTYLLEKSILKNAGSVQQARGEMASVNFQLLNMMAKIRTTGAERAAFSQWAKRYTKLTQVNYNLNRLTNVIVALRTVFDNLGMFIIFMMIGLQGQVLFSFFQQPTEASILAAPSLQAVIPTSHFISFNIAYGMFAGSIFTLINVAIQMLGVKPLSRRLMPILEQEPEKTEDLIAPETINGHVKIQNVNFRYGPTGHWVLNNISLEVKPGQWAAIVGASGCGKTTLIRLLLGFETPTMGSLSIDSQELTTLNMTATRRHFGVVLQNSALVAGSIYHNVAAGLELTEQEVWDALKIAQLDEDVAAMPMQLDTLVSEGAKTLSVGQKQRVMIARAIARKPRLLIFDEATSALDNTTQAKISEHLVKLACTRIFIAHRYTTIMKADVIYVIDKGGIVEQGNYNELMAKQGHFYSLVQRQVL